MCEQRKYVQWLVLSAKVCGFLYIFPFPLQMNRPWKQSPVSHTVMDYYCLWNILLFIAGSFTPLSHFISDWKRQRLPGVNGPDIYTHAYDIKYMHAHTSVLNLSQRWQTRAAGPCCFSCFDCFCLGTKYFTHILTEKMLLSHNGIKMEAAMDCSLFPLSCSKSGYAGFFSSGTRGSYTRRNKHGIQAQPPLGHIDTYL